MKTPAVFEMPSEQDLEEGPIAGNCEYRDLRDTEWIEVEEAIAHDHTLIELMEDAVDARDAYYPYIEDREQEYEESGNRDGFLRLRNYSELDPGVASAVLALGATGAAPVRSCNGGVFGDAHFDKFPHVCFYAPPALESVVTEAAARSGLELEQNAFTGTPIALAFGNSTVRQIRYTAVGGAANDLIRRHLIPRAILE